jgi:hypothetical protein
MRRLRTLEGLGPRRRQALTVVKGELGSAQVIPALARPVNGWLAIFRMAMIAVSLVARGLSSVLYVSTPSLWALVHGHGSAWQAARMMVNQEARTAAARRTARRATSCSDRSRRPPWSRVSDSAPVWRRTCRTRARPGAACSCA